MPWAVSEVTAEPGNAYACSCPNFQCRAGRVGLA
jgi:hypothetical protein